MKGRYSAAALCVCLATAALAHQGVENPVGVLQHAAGQLNLGILGHGARIQTQLQGFGTCDGTKGKQHQNG